MDTQQDIPKKMAHRCNPLLEGFSTVIQLMARSLLCMRQFIFCMCCTVLISNASWAAEGAGWQKILGQVEPQPMLGFGMWSYHLKHESEDMDNSRNDLFGFSDRGYFIATLINSENRRSFAAGIQRYWLRKELAPDWTYQLGYRLGLIYGYDRKLGKYAAHIPVVPFPQFISDLTWKHFGWEISYTWVVVSTSFYYRF